MQTDLGRAQDRSAVLAVVSVSGGKDSTATALLARATLPADACRFVLADTGNEHDETLRYVTEYLPTVFGPIDTVRADFSEQIARKRQYAADTWPAQGIPDNIVRWALSVLTPTGIPFLDLCLWKGRFPSRMAQFCTQFLKRHPLDRYLLELMAAGFAVESWRGVRREESRSRRATVERERVAEGFDIVHPIAAWSAQETIDYVVRHGVHLNPLYSQGMHRVGCMPCINCRESELLQIGQRFPHHIDRIREWEELISMASKRGWTTFFADSFRDGETSEEIFARMRIDARVRWAATTRGGRQIDFLSTLPPPACSSVYGLCD